ncbi:hypothetical protein KR222_010587 [Zaprionus bogoriensis]|nr:hypothetical protein KR222_010587 [Zaprionus bogoriensis]
MLILTINLLRRANANLFASRLFASIAALENRDNFVICPSIIEASLALVYLGVSGQAATELKMHLQLRGNSKDDDIKEYKSQILRISNSNIEFLTTFKMFVDQMYPVNSVFQQKAISYFHTYVENIKFSDGGSIAKKISSYIEANTQFKFKDIINNVDIDVSTKSVLLQGFFFKGKFEQPFMQTRTRRKFHYRANSSVSLVTYVNNEEFPYGYVPRMDSYGLEVPFKDSNISLLFLLPVKRTANLKGMENQLRNLDIRSMTKNFETVFAYVQIPRFSIEYETELTEAVQNIDIRAIFEYPRFDFLTNTPNLRLSTTFHKGLVVIDCGTEDCQTFKEFAKPDIKFTVNHPFMFVIRDDNRIYFIGRVKKPI